MIAAELEMYHSRPIAPTRRVSLGSSKLPVDPAPGYGGVLLGGVVARFIADVDPDMAPDLHRLVHELEHGHRVPQPRLRYRFQRDHIGLLRTRHRLLRDDRGEMTFDLDASRAAPEQHVLCAIYAAGDLDTDARRVVMDVIRRGLKWSGPVGPKLHAHLLGRSDVSALEAGLDDPIAWALDVLGLPAAEREVERAVVMSRFRVLLREAHPDHGGQRDDAAGRIEELTRARRILLP